MLSCQILIVNWALEEWHHLWRDCSIARAPRSNLGDGSRKHNHSVFPFLQAAAILPLK